jgi:3',5'-cyclic AMP phosphodiesterase CpdA
MKRIIHMSDLHVGHEDLGDRFRAIIRNLKSEKEDKPEEYVILITGDLVDTANQVRYDEVKTGLDSLKDFGFKHILLVPGNHDYGSGSKAEKKFVRLFKQTFFDKQIQYPKLDIIGDRDGDIAFIALDSMAEELHWYDELFGDGELGERQLQDLKLLLHRDDVRSCRFRVIYLHHHPFDAFPLYQLKDSEELKGVLKDTIKTEISIDALLYGHNHLGKVHNGHWGIPRCYDAGTATGKERHSYIDWFPWFKIKISTRCIRLDKPVYYDYVIDLL